MWSPDIWNETLWQVKARSIYSEIRKKNSNFISSENRSRNNSADPRITTVVSTHRWSPMGGHASYSRPGNCPSAMRGRSSWTWQRERFLLRKLLTLASLSAARIRQRMSQKETKSFGVKLFMCGTSKLSAYFSNYPSVGLSVCLLKAGDEVWRCGGFERSLHQVCCTICLPFLL